MPSPPSRSPALAALLVATTLLPGAAIAQTGARTVAPAATAPASRLPRPASRPPDPGATRDLTSLSRALEVLAGRVGPAIAYVVASGYGSSGEETTTDDLLAPRKSGGSAVILDPSGYLVTNAHVVRGALRVRVVLGRVAEGAPGKSILKAAARSLDARIVGVDLETDLAVLKVEASGLPALELADSDGVAPGQIVLAFGSPLRLENSVTLGVVSAAARQLEPESPMIYIQTDAPINPGSSGGALIDTAGRLVGLNTLIYSQSGGSEGIGFAAPSNIVRSVYEQIRAHGRVRRGEVGLLAQTVTPLLAAGLKLPRDWGVIVGDVEPDGPAATAGVRIGDLVLALDGKPMENGRQLDVNLYRKAPGSRVLLDLQRGEERTTATVDVRERPDDPQRFAMLVDPTTNLVRKLGILALPVGDQTAALLPALRLQEGILVAALAAGAPAGEGGLLPGDVIHALNRQVVSTLASLHAALEDLPASSAVVLQVERAGRYRFVALELN